MYGECTGSGGCIVCMCGESRESVQCVYGE